MTPVPYNVRRQGVVVVSVGALLLSLAACGGGDEQAPASFGGGAGPAPTYPLSVVTESGPRRQWNGNVTAGSCVTVRDFPPDLQVRPCQSPFVELINGTSDTIVGTLDAQRPLKLTLQPRMVGTFGGP